VDLIEFEEQTLVVAKDQPQYTPMPAHMDAGSVEKRLTCCWQLTLWERIKLLVTGRIWHQVLTFGAPLQPQLLLLDKPKMRTPLEQLRNVEPGA
jgi:hypothetical protein